MEDHPLSAVRDCFIQYRPYLEAVSFIRNNKGFRLVEQLTFISVSAIFVPKRNDNSSIFSVYFVDNKDVNLNTARVLLDGM
jgi:hypothetical protein